jgi:glutamate dehydrogenase (NADP+)
VNDYVAELMADVKARNPVEPEFHQAVQEVAESLTLVLAIPHREVARADH